MKDGSHADIVIRCLLFVLPVTIRLLDSHRTTRCGFAQLPAAEDQSLLGWGNTRLLLHLLLDLKDLNAGGGLQNVSIYAQDI